MDIAQMRQILAIREHGSFAKAAQALGIAQPSLSKSIARLEDQLKARIFDRSPAGSELTPIGELIVERAAGIVTEADEILRDAALVARGEAGLARIGMGSSLAGEFLSRLLNTAAERHPGLRLHVEGGAWAGLLPALAAREVDIVFCALPKDPLDPDFVMTGLFTCGAVAVAAPDHPLARMKKVEMEDFVRFKSAGAPGSFRNAAVLGLDDYENLSFYTANGYEYLLPLVVSGKATLVAPDFTVKPLIEAGVVARLNMPIDFALSFVAVTTRAAAYSPILTRLIRYAGDIGQVLEAEWRAATAAATSQARPPGLTPAAT